MTTTIIPAPLLGTVAQGIATLWGIEATGFSSDGSFVLVKASYSDSAFPALSTRSAFWLYDLNNGNYGDSINALIATDGRPIEVTDVKVGSFGAQTQLVVTYQDTEAVPGFVLNKVAIIRDNTLIQSDVVAQLFGNSADAQISAVRVSPDGRFMAIETTATNLTTDLDTNDCKDVYAVDLTLSKVYRVSAVNSSEQYQDALLGNVVLGTDGTLSVSFQSVAAFAGNDTNGVADVFVWKLSGATSATHGAVDISLISKTSTGAAGGENPFLTTNGTFFDSASASFSNSDTNNATDVWRDTGAAISLISPGSAWLSQGAHLGSVSEGGRYAAILTASPEIAGGTGVDQLLVVDTVAGGYQTVSRSATGALADDAAFAAVLSADGTRIAFSSQASNLATGATDGSMHLYVANLTGPADSTAGTTNHSPTGAVVITGVGLQSQTLTAEDTLADLDGLGAITYQWKLNGAAIGNAITRTYGLTASEVGKAVTVTANYTDGHGTAESATSLAVIPGGPLDDVLTGTSGADVIYAGLGADKIVANAGDDSIYLAYDAAWSNGVMIINTGSPSVAGTNEKLSLGSLNRFTDVSDGGLGTDTIQLTTGPDAYFLDDAFSAFNSNVTLVSGSTQKSSTQREVSIEKILAGEGDDVVDLTSTDYTYGAVTVDGGGGNDILWTNAGNDSLIGGAGNDTLFGGAGNDTLNGGTGADVFQFVKLGGGQDIIVDFTPGTDKIRLFTAASVNEVQVAVAADHVTLTWGAAVITLTGVTSSTGSATWFQLG